ncbi:IS6 family transposase [Candidatus Nitrospira neomarina]|uniref:IS6 family transposase n=1 Tax=Candidatus Nitrospira neomarina TaxID=3020899 RepID=A0AA96GHB2_9BACT|nr:IS6 family transposase [Candidatus Nitrospira neomarina]WNM61896.1 IS6 family transposase [Candidatus Nitrospira neomarina]
MNSKRPNYQRHRFPSEIISHEVWLYHRFCLSFREVEEFQAERGITVTYEAVHQWCQKFCPDYARKLKKRQGRLGDTWHIDEVFVTIQGKRHYLWWAVDQNGYTIDILVQRRCNQRTAERVFFSMLIGQGWEPQWLVTDKLRGYDAAHRTIIPTVNHINHVYANNRTEVSYQPTRQCECHMRGFSSSSQAQQFLTLHGLTQNLFHLGRHLIQAVNYRLLRSQAFQFWKKAVGGSHCLAIPFHCAYSPIN